MTHKLYSAERRAHRKKFYNSKAWARRSAYQKKIAPLCEECKKYGILKTAKIADHIDPCWQTGREFIRGKLQSLCVECDQEKRFFSDIPLMRNAEKSKLRFF